MYKVLLTSLQVILGILLPALPPFTMLSVRLIEWTDFPNIIGLTLGLVRSLTTPIQRAIVNDLADRRLRCV